MNVPLSVLQTRRLSTAWTKKRRIEAHPAMCGVCCFRHTVPQAINLPLRFPCGRGSERAAARARAGSRRKACYRRIAAREGRGAARECQPGCRYGGFASRHTSATGGGLGRAPTAPGHPVPTLPLLPPAVGGPGWSPLRGDAERPPASTRCGAEISHVRLSQLQTKKPGAWPGSASGEEGRKARSVRYSAASASMVSTDT